jgi:hypothetical protein
MKQTPATVARSLCRVQPAIRAITTTRLKCRKVTGPLGGRLKTGHRWTLQNRPTELNQNKSIYTPGDDHLAIIFSRASPAGLY